MFFPHNFVWGSCFCFCILRLLRRLPLRRLQRHEWLTAAAVESADQGRTATVVRAPWWRKTGTGQVLCFFHNCSPCKVNWDILNNFEGLGSWWKILTWSEDDMHNDSEILRRTSKRVLDTHVIMQVNHWPETSRSPRPHWIACKFQPLISCWTSKFHTWVTTMDHCQIGVVFGAMNTQSSKPRTDGNVFPGCEKCCASQNVFWGSLLITKGSVSYLSSPCFSTIIGGIGGPARGKRRILDVMY